MSPVQSLHGPPFDQEDRGRRGEGHFINPVRVGHDRRPPGPEPGHRVRDDFREADARDPDQLVVRLRGVREGAHQVEEGPERELAADFNRTKLLNQIKSAYQRAPYFVQTFPLVEQIVRYEDTNLFRFLHHSIARTCEHLGIATEIRISSGIAIDHDLKNQDKVLALCEAVGASTYVNAVGGMELYSKKMFREKGIELKFIQSKRFEYAQFGDAFVPWLSIIDVMMFNSKEETLASITGNFNLI